jgi:hypothetical protein
MVLFGTQVAFFLCSCAVTFLCLFRGIANASSLSTIEPRRSKISQPTKDLLFSPLWLASMLVGIQQDMFLKVMN